MDISRCDIRLFIPPEDEIEPYKRCMLALLGIELDDIRTLRANAKGVAFIQSRAQGFEERVLIVLNGHVTTKKGARSLLERIVAALDAQDRAFLLETIETRIDDDLTLYLRLDKHLFLNDIFKLTDTGSCYHFSFSLVTYPKNREQAVNAVREILT